MRVFDLGAGEGPEHVVDRVWTVPNVLSMLRLAALPFIVLDLVGERWTRALVLLAVFCATDWLDGYLARRLGQVSRLGQLLDPTSDRLLLVGVGIGFVVAGVLPWWAVAALVGRDVVVVVIGAALVARGTPPPPVSRLGKAATFALMWALPGLLLARVLGQPGAPQPVVQALSWGVLVLGTVLYYAAAVGYARVLARRAA